MLDNFRINLLTLRRVDASKCGRELRPTFHSSRGPPDLVVAGAPNREVVERLVCSFGASHTLEDLRFALLVVLLSLCAVVIGLSGVLKLTQQTRSENRCSLPPLTTDPR